MKIRSRKFKPSWPPDQGKIYKRNSYQNYNNYSSAGSVNLYRRNNGYKVYSKYKYPNSSVKKSSRSDSRKLSSRPVSPVLGSEEYMKKKIEQTSAIIMRQLLSPDEEFCDDKKLIGKNRGKNSVGECSRDIQVSNESKKCMNSSKIEHTSTIIMNQLLIQEQQFCENINQIHRKNEEKCTINARTENKITDIESSSKCNKSKVKKNGVYNIGEIHKKIVNHITNLNEGKKKNLINCDMSGYDIAIEQIQKQKRLEISRALRVMCSQSEVSQESSDFINSIIPDIGIKIEDLPRNLIEELRDTLSLDADWTNDDLFHNYANGSDFFIGTNQAYMENLMVDCTDFALEKSSAEIFIKLEPTDGVNFHKQCETNENQNVENLIINLNNTEDHVDGIHENSSDKKTTDTAIIIKKEICELEEKKDEGNVTKSACDHSESRIDIKLEPIDHCDDEGTNCQINVLDDIKDESVDSYDATITHVNQNTCEESETEQIHEVSSKKAIVESIPQCDVPDDVALDIKSTTFMDTSVPDDSQEIKEANYDENVAECNSKNLQLTLPTCVKTGQGLRHKSNIEMDRSLTTNISTQTEDETHSGVKFIDNFLAKYYKQNPKSISEAISRMLEIDQCVQALTNYRQSLFADLKLDDKVDVHVTNAHKTITMSSKKRKKGLKKTRSKKKKNLNLKSQITGDNDFRAKHIENENIDSRGVDTTVLFEGSKIPADFVNSTSHNDLKISDIGKCSTFKEVVSQPPQKKKFTLQDLHEKVLVIKITEDKLVAGTESGKLIFYNLEDGSYSKILDCSYGPITSLLCIKHDNKSTNMYVGSFDSVLKIYNVLDYSVPEDVALEEGVQCLENKWGYVFIGCIRGALLRYSLKKKIIEFEDRISDAGVLVLKATQEGARRVLLVGCRNSPVCIRDAMTGLYMRTMENVISPTVYSLILENSLVYCGTTNHDILIYSFHNGKLVHRHKATNSKGIGCMKITSNLLFASCHNGNIYVYDIKKHAFISTIEGPGGVILSMEVFDNQIIIGTMSFKFTSLPIPNHILRHKI